VPGTPFRDVPESHLLNQESHLLANSLRKVVKCENVLLGMEPRTQADPVCGAL
jgi:hypothetical protein